ncbi:MAG: cupredoxin domain-containing protein [Rhodospirillales bacterium]|nr:cupredoxin domain-containing protein [Rhodospirillales bacterium]
MRLAVLTAAMAALICLPDAARADDPVVLTLKDHKFSPDRVEVPAGKQITLLVRNQDTTAEEFESLDLKREKIVASGKEIKVLVGPLKPGEYKFFGEFNADTAKGVLVAR